MKKVISGILMISLLLGIVKGNMIEQQNIQASLAQKVIRFHVLANSDDAEDQSVKLKVRDVICGYMEKELQNISDKEESEQCIKNRLEKIEQLARKVLKQEGKSYDVTARLCVIPFPEKEYEGHIFPAGKYEALQVTLGQGEGHNWWCVMYPNLCFSKSIYHWNQKEWNKLKKSMTTKEYYHIIQNKKYIIRLKFLEYFRKKG